MQCKGANFDEYNGLTCKRRRCITKAVAQEQASRKKNKEEEARKNKQEARKNKEEARKKELEGKKRDNVPVSVVPWLLPRACARSTRDTCNCLPDE